MLKWETSEKTDDKVRNKISRLEKELKSRRKPPEDYRNKELEYNFCDEYEEMESDAYDYGVGSGNVSVEEAAAESRRSKSVIEIPTLAPLLLEDETIITEKSLEGVHVHSPLQDEESVPGAERAARAQARFYLPQQPAALGKPPAAQCPPLTNRLQNYHSRR
ncbi:unnamed protein product [Parnassius apollo]|uniref:(apollo) hypothetical protein n=1 Tax=Parnassius apollo TaxID=110799 RepID=A0A8S3XXB5_PARAO|nr:unnamed protein product [Parnassius apollo]